ncbi:MAG: S9 family peptidase [Candidatus Acidiferrales bacterium]
MRGRICAKGIFFPAIFFLAAGLCVQRAQAQSPNGHGKELTIERIFGRPGLNGTPTRGLEWAPDGTRLSFYHATEDHRMELWVMDAASGDHRVLVSADKLASLLQPPKEPQSQATGLGRRPPEDYFWAPNGNALLFASNGELVWLDLESLKATHLLAGDSAVADVKISPDGHWASYVQDHNLWIVSTAGGEPKQLTRGGSELFREGELDWVYPEELDLSTAYWWSPDSQHIAYLEMDERKVTKFPLVDYLTVTGETRMEDYPKAGTPNPTVRVGVVGVDTGKTQWITTGDNADIYLARVNWLPDNQRLAIQRLNRAQNRLDFLLASIDSGQSQSIFSESDPYWINISDDLHFFSDGTRFLWTSERGGFRHLYIYDIAGNSLEQLTKGDWAVSGFQGFGPGSESGLVVDEKNGFVYFSSNKDDVTQTQLYRLSLKDKSIERVTQGEGTHFIEMSPNAQYFVDLYSTSTAPARTELYRSSGRHIATINENKVPELAEYHLSPVEYLTVTAADGTKLYASMLKPPDFDASKKYPVLVSVYGGPHAQLVRKAWGGPTFLWHQLMAQKGYIIFTLDNRGSYGRGHNFESPIYHHFGKLELEDQLAGVRYLKSQPYVDGSRIGIWGWSYGGFMTLNAMVNGGGTFKAGFAGSPVSDWREYDTIYTERYMGTPEENSDGYHDSSPYNQAAHLQGKLMIACGTGDDNVHFGNTIEFLENLIAADKWAEVAIYPNRGHGISDPPARIQLFQHVTRFFLDNL